MIKISHFVKCKICGERFDRDTEPNEKVSSTRYAHERCILNYEPSQDALDLAELHKYLKKLFGDRYNYIVLQKQIETFVEVNKYTYTGILKSLVYWYEVKENTLEKANNRIGIVPFIYQDARDYYLALYMAGAVNADKNLQDYKQPEIREIRIKPPTRDTIDRRLFNLDD